MQRIETIFKQTDINLTELQVSVAKFTNVLLKIVTYAENWNNILGNWHGMLMKIIKRNPRALNSPNLLENDHLCCESNQSSGIWILLSRNYSHDNKVKPRLSGSKFTDIYRSWLFVQWIEAIFCRLSSISKNALRDNKPRVWGSKFTDINWTSVRMMSIKALFCQFTFLSKNVRWHINPRVSHSKYTEIPENDYLCCDSKQTSAIFTCIHGMFVTVTNRRSRVRTSQIVPENSYLCSKILEK